MRKSLYLALAAAFTLSAAGYVFAQGHGHKHGSTTHITGEVVDISCYINHDGKGAKHKRCAQSCLSKGLPMGLLTKDGKLYLLIEDHHHAEAYKSVKSRAAQTVTITGSVHNKGGVQGLTVEAVK